MLSYSCRIYSQIFQAFNAYMIFVRKREVRFYHCLWLFIFLVDFWELKLKSDNSLSIWIRSHAIVQKTFPANFGKSSTKTSSKWRKNNILLRNFEWPLRKSKHKDKMETGNHSYCFTDNHSYCFHRHFVKWLVFFDAKWDSSER